MSAEQSTALTVQQRGKKTLIDISGGTFGRLTVIGRAENHSSQHARWICLCECGNTTTVFGRYLRGGQSKSCGCLHRELTVAALRKHGHAPVGKKTSTYRTWVAMRERCESPSNAAFDDYGARGITVCERWQSFENFLADMGERPRGLTIERADVNGNYEPSNCRWASLLDQANNTRANVQVHSSAGKHTLANFARLHGLNYSTTRIAMKKGRRLFAGERVFVEYPGGRS